MKNNRIQLSISKDLQGFIPVSLDFNKLEDITCCKNYSAITFKNNYRTISNFQEAELCILDFDENLTLENAKKIFAKYKAIIVTTKSHQKGEKNGKKIKEQDKFRVILRFSEPIKDYKIYTNLMKKLTSKYKSDKSCTDSARFFYPNPYQKVWYSKGTKKINVNLYTEELSNDKDNFLNIHTHANIQVDSHNPLIIDKLDNQLTAFEWSQIVDNNTVTIHCPNQKHPDIHPSAFLSKSTKYKNKIYIYCHKCGPIGLYPKINNK